MQVRTARSELAHFSPQCAKIINIPCKNSYYYDYYLLLRLLQRPSDMYKVPPDYLSGWPGGMRVCSNAYDSLCIICRNLLSAVRSICLLVQHSLARKGLALFNRSAHTARQGRYHHGMWAEDQPNPMQPIPAQGGLYGILLGRSFLLRTIGPPSG